MMTTTTMIEDAGARKEEYRDKNGDDGSDQLSLVEKEPMDLRRARDGHKVKLSCEHREGQGLRGRNGNGAVHNNAAAM